MLFNLTVALYSPAFTPVVNVTVAVELFEVVTALTVVPVPDIDIVKYLLTKFAKSSIGFVAFIVNVITPVVVLS